MNRAKSRVTKSFRERLKRLPAPTQDQARRAYRLWRRNPRHPSLRFKRVSQRQPIYSVRISTGYRALGLWEADGIYRFWIGSHREYEEFLKRL